MLPFYGFGKQLNGNATLTGTDAPIDSSAVGTAGTNSLTATNPSFTPGRFILILNIRGAYATTGEVNQIQSYSAGTITTVNKLLYNYSVSGQEKAIVIQLPEYGLATIGGSHLVKAWDGSVGGVLAFMAQETIITGGAAINGTGRGFRKGDAVTGTDQVGKQGEGTTGAGNTQSISNNGNGGGGGGSHTSGAAGGSGAGGGNGTSGTGSFTVGTSGASVGGTTSGNAALTDIAMGGAGGSGGTRFGSPENSGAGGNGGAIVIIFSRKITIQGGIHVGGDVGGNPSRDGMGAGGGGAGGSILLRAVEANIGTNLLTALGGAGGATPGPQEDGGNGGNGRIRVEACKITGSTTQGEATMVSGGHNWCGSLASLIE